MNKKVYLCDLDFTRIQTGYKNDGTPNFMVNGGVKATIIFNNIMSYDEFKKIRDNTYFYLTNEDYKSRIDKAIEYIELKRGKNKSNYDCEILNILRGEDNE